MTSVLYHDMTSWKFPFKAEIKHFLKRLKLTVKVTELLALHSQTYIHSAVQGRRDIKIAKSLHRKRQQLLACLR